MLTAYMTGSLGLALTLTCPTAMPVMLARAKEGPRGRYREEKRERVLGNSQTPRRWRCACEGSCCVEFSFFTLCC
ncbi:hypothetical protein RRG08_042528 [Elysia crispata]|uniref:Uncharacterized protein n=1 Tax=Elysia crispata TaxID=231223 RepID=A0AAE0XQA6_9GAST|nr:hypothetical protein RRG08_042528 [Elysia crispata]